MNIELENLINMALAAGCCGICSVGLLLNYIENKLTYKL